MVSENLGEEWLIPRSQQSLLTMNLPRTNFRYNCDLVLQGNTLGKCGLPRQLGGKEFACQCRRHGFDPWVRKISLGRKWQHTLVFLPSKSDGQRNLVRHGPWSQSQLGN